MKLLKSFYYAVLLAFVPALFAALLVLRLTAPVGEEPLTVLSALRVLLSALPFVLLVAELGLVIGRLGGHGGRAPENGTEWALLLAHAVLSLAGVIAMTLHLTAETSGALVIASVCMGLTVLLWLSDTLVGKRSPSACKWAFSRAATWFLALAICLASAGVTLCIRAAIPDPNTPGNTPDAQISTAAQKVQSQIEITYGLPAYTLERILLSHDNEKGIYLVTVTGNYVHNGTPDRRMEIYDIDPVDYGILHDEYGDVLLFNRAQTDGYDTIRTALSEKAAALLIQITCENR